MTVTVRGKVEGGKLVLQQLLPLPEGSEVVVHIEPVSASQAPPQDPAKDFAALPCFGMWADREDMKDAIAWVRREREKWHQRALRRD